MLAIINNTNNQSGKICKNCSVRKLKQYCKVCGNLNSVEKMRWDFDSTIKCEACFSHTNRKCQSCDIEPICYCSCGIFWCRKCSEMHFISIFLELKNHRYKRIDIESVIPDFETDYYTTYKTYSDWIITMAEKGLKEQELTEAHSVRETLNNFQMGISSIVEYRCKIQEDLIKILNYSIGLYGSDSQEIGITKLRLEIARIDILNGCVQKGLEKLHKIPPTGLEAEFLNLYVFHAHPEMIVRNEYLKSINYDITSLKNTFNKIEDYMMTKIKLKQVREKKYKLKKLKSQIMQESAPCLSVVKAFLICLNKSSSDSFINYAIEYTENYFQDIPELSMLIDKKINTLCNEDNHNEAIYQCAKHSLQIKMNSYIPDSEEIADGLYNLAKSIHHNLSDSIRNHQTDQKIRQQQNKFTAVCFQCINLATKLKMKSLINKIFPLYAMLQVQGRKEFILKAKLAYLDPDN